MDKNDSFKILKNTKYLAYEIIELSYNFPRKDMVVTKSLQKELFNLIRLLNSYIVNKTSTRIKEKYIKDFIVSLSMTDFYLEYYYQNRNISFKKYKDLIDEIIMIRKLAYGVLKNEKELSKI